jgi:LysM repeat protein/ABC-type branched-subunit amino acid transport system substrate-binding protein
MMMVIKKIVFVVLFWAVFLLIPLSAVAQSDAVTVKKINGKEYFIHTVKKGETVSGIAKKYRSSLSSVMNENPHAGDNIKPGDELKIPVTNKNKSLVNSNETVETNSTIQIADTVKSNGNKHIVQRGETIYGIARKYKISQDDLLSLNPNASNGISPGDVLLLPKNSNAVSDNTHAAAPKRVLVGYVVKQQETFFSISRKFNISVDSIKLLNNGLTQGLKSGSQINLYVTESGVALIKNENGGTIEPLVIPVDRDKQVVNSVFKSGKKDKYSVGLVMPFMFEKNSEYMRDNENRDRPLMYEPTRQSVDFYHGVKVAFDSLAAAGLNVEVTIYDSARDTASLRKICEGTGFALHDIIIGPTENFDMVGKYAKKYGIPAVCPVAYSNRVLLDNPFLFKMIGSASVMADKASQFIANNYSDQNIIMIDGKGKSDVGIIKAYKKYLNRYLMKKTGRTDSVKVIAMDYFTMKTLEAHLDKSKKNIIVIPTSDQVYVSVALSNLNKYLARYNHKTEEVIVFGTEEWLKMEDIDITYKLRAQVHVPSPTLIDYDTLQTRKFISSYRNRFKTDPDKYALMGFDIAYFWLAGYLQHGLDFNNMVVNYELDMLQTGMRFKKMNETSGYLNCNVYMLKYENYQLIPQKQ